jgi:KDO2-lipid IV(A) lauroyltransferase
MLLKIFFLYTVRYLIPLLPHSVLMIMAAVTGWFSARGNTAFIIKNELRKVLGNRIKEAELEQITLKAQQDFHKDLFEIWSFPRITKKKMEEISDITGKEHIDMALQKGRGVIIGVTHFGSWKIIIPALSYAGYPVHQIAINPLDFTQEESSFYQKQMMQIEYRCEQSLPAHFIYIGKFMRDVHRAFQRNEVVIDSLDGTRKKETVEIALLETRIMIDPSPIRLALRFNNPLLPAFAVRQEDNRHKIVIHADIMEGISSDNEISVETALNRFIEVFEKHVLEKPSHYGRILYLSSQQHKI